MAALDQAGTIVCEPMIRVSLEIPAETVGSVLAAVARAQDLQRQLPGLTSGEGVAETSFGGYRPLANPAGQAQSRGAR
jgi:ribosomal protection tetracycline resistance protein